MILLLKLQLSRPRGPFLRRPLSLRLSLNLPRIPRQGLSTAICRTVVFMNKAHTRILHTLMGHVQLLCLCGMNRELRTAGNSLECLRPSNMTRLNDRRLRLRADETPSRRQRPGEVGPLLILASALMREGDPACLSPVGRRTSC